MNHLMSELETDLGGSAIVFAPHPDDETLGCGGTIIKKRRTGADVKIVFMTDGSYSPDDLMSADELRSIRLNEALAASRLLGIDGGDVVFLEFEVGKLGENLDSAINRVTEILLKQPSREIFIPYYKDKHLLLDHVATNRIVVSALQVLGRKAIIYEYPIWFWWNFWPWTSVYTRSRRKTLKFLKKSLASGLSLLRDFRCSVYIGDVLELKRAALDQHKSQMTRLVPDSRWPTLGDVSNGEFLECFFQEHEIFYRYSLPDQFDKLKVAWDVG
jgi:LmbE family N-acetylglucosaminyl deacetylase